MSKLRVGLLIDSYTVTHWEYKMIEAIAAGNYADIVLIVKRKESASSKKTLLQKLSGYFKNGFFKLYTRVERKIYKASPDAFSKKDFQTLTGNAAFLEVKCIEKKFSDYIAPDDVAVIKQHEIDVFIRLGFRILRGDILKTARMGIWSYHHGDNFLYRGGPAGHWEVLKRERETGSILQILSEDMDGGQVIFRSWSPVDVSATKTLNTLFWKTSLFIPRKLKELHEKGSDFFFNKIKQENENLNFYSAKNYKLPGNITFIKLFIPFLFKTLSHKIWKIFNFQQWVLLYSFTSSVEMATSIFRYTRIVPPKDRYWADPFAVANNQKYYIFFEEVIYGKNNNRGHICVSEINKKGEFSKPVVILQKTYHLSYPFVFAHKGNYYMIPESEQDATIQLYESVSFPFEWKFRMNLMENVRAVDTTIYFRNDKFWLFTCIRENEGSYSGELFLFSSAELLSANWKPHTANPIISDVRTSRPAGRIFHSGTKTYRPVQDCSYRYGYATIINEIMELSEEAFIEKKATEILPDWADDVVATHTFTHDEGLSVIDATINRRKNINAFFRKR